LDEMICEPTDDGQGSVVCTFRMVPPSDRTYINQYNHCMKDGKGDEFCIKTEVFRKVTPTLETVSSSVESVPSSTETTATASTNFFEDDGATGATSANQGVIIDTIDTIDSEPTPSTAASGGLGGVGLMKCPRYKPSSGSPCGGWLYESSNYGSCVFPRRNSVSGVCNCDNRANHVDAKKIYWVCDGDGYEILQETTIDITANVNGLQEPPAIPEPSSPTLSTAGTINVPRPINDESCPIPTPVDGDYCVELKRCGYWDKPVSPTKLIDCRCNTYNQFHCRDADQALYGFYGSSF